VDAEGVVRYWNHSAELTTGVDALEAVGRGAAEVVPSWELLTEHVRPASSQTGELARAVTVPINLQGRERWLSVAAVDFGEGQVYALRDVTEEQLLEQERRDFVATASHELRTPLAAVYGAVRTLRREDVELDHDDTEMFLGIIESETERLGRIVSQILVAGQLESEALRLSETECDLRELSEGVLAAARVRAPESISLRLESHGELPPVRCDEDKLRQVLVNLVENAIKYSPDGGDVKLELGATNGVARIAVRDRGLGIPAGEQQRVFEKFTRLDPEQTRGVGGTGLGLYIARELIERMGGRIDLDSTVGAGSTFTVELPLGDRPSP
jgi:PAS domain S-box-containing protein